MPALCAAFLVGFIATYCVLVSQGEAGPKRSDFVPYYAAAALVAHGSGDALYNWAAIGARERVLVHPLVVRDGAMPFLYPPYVAVALSPLARLPYTVAYIVWLVSNLALLFLALAALHRHLGLRGREALLLWLPALSSLPVLVCLAQGQVSILLLALFVIAALAEQGGRGVVAGAALALALVKPAYVLPLLVVLCARRRWSTVGAFLATAAGLTLISILGAGTAGVAAFMHMLLHATGWSGSVGGFQPRFNQSFAGFSQLIASGLTAAVLTACLDGLALLALVWLSLRSKDAHMPLAGAVLVGLLISPHTLLHDLSLLILPAALILAPPRPARVTVVLVTALYISAVVALPLSVLRLQAPVLSMAALLAWLAGCETFTGLMEPALRPLTATILPWRTRNADS